MKSGIFAAVLLLGLGGVLGYAVYSYGGVMPSDLMRYMFALALLGLAYWATTPRTALAPPLESALQWPTVLLPCYAAFQIMPLPRTLLAVLSPNRPAVAAALQPILPGYSYSPLSVSPGLTFRHLLQISGYLLCFLLARELGWHFRNRRWLPLLPILAIAACEATFGLFQLASQSETGVSGTYANRNHFAGFLEMSLPLAVVCCWAGLRRRRSGNRDGEAHVMMWTGGIAAVLIFVGVICSLSRAGFIGSVLALVVLTGSALLLNNRSSSKLKPLFATLFAGVSLAALYLVLAAPEPLAGRFADLAGGDENRAALWAQTLHVIAEYPVFGCGLGGYESAFLKYKNVKPMLGASFAHNDYLQFLAELGVVGFAIGAVFFIGVLMGVIHSARRSRWDEDRLIAQGCLGALVAIAFHSLVDFNLYFPANAMLLAWICGLAASLTARPQRAAPVLTSEQSGAHTPEAIGATP